MRTPASTTTHEAKLGPYGRTSPEHDKKRTQNTTERPLGIRAIVNPPGGPAPVELRVVPEPTPGPNEALVEVKAFSLNRGELRSFVNNEAGWIPGQDISGVVRQAAANGLGPPNGTRVVALTDEFGW